MTTDPNGYTRTTVSDLNLGVVTSDVKGSSNVWYYGHDSQGRLTTITEPLGTISGGVPTHGYTKYTYNSRGDITNTTIYPQSGSGTIATSATYPSSCTSPNTPAMCNKPTATFDANGYETDYAWDSTYGVLTSATSPSLTGAAPANTGTRPQTRYSYTSKAARYLTLVGGVPTMTTASDPVYLMTGSSVCSSGTSPSCVGTANETVTTVAYANAVGGYNNLLPSSVTTAEGDSPAHPLTSTVSATYDQIGNLASITDPLTHATNFNYDADRQMTYMIGPDPDGSGSLKFRALHVVYNHDGFPKTIKQGTATSATGWSTFLVLQEADVTYDGIDRKTQVNVVAGGTTQAITQYSYDDANRLTCTAVRLKLTSLPTDACASATTDSPDGPDRITKTQYNAADQVTKVKQGLNESVQRDYADYSYTADGLVETLTDGQTLGSGAGNQTKYVYDAYDRLQKVEYPVKTPVGAGSPSTTDYEQYTYDTTRITNVRRRDGSNIGLSYYNTNWLYQKSPPTTNDFVVTNLYDLMGRLTQTSGGGQIITMGYDQLSRMTSQSGALGEVDYQYDVGGNRTQMTWPDGVYVTYDYDAANELSHIRESGAGSGVRVLATYTYDDLGRRAGMDRGNGVSTTFSYTGAWLTTLTQGLDSPNAQTLTFASNAAGQFKSRASNNNAYAWDGASNFDITYAPNGLNQLTTAGTATLGYDSLGNLTSDGTNTYGYDPENRMISVSGGASATLGYDALGRLYKTTGSSTVKYLYDGVDLIAETDSSGDILRRYVHGPGADEPITWYEGSGVTNRNWLIADEKGSITAVTDSTGAASNVNTYDEYGLPGSTNAGRFQYTGQNWLPDVGLYYDKARIYSPTLGRFMQTDPAGYDAGINLYAYVGNDPANGTDPSGMDGQCPNAGGGGGGSNCPTQVAEFVVTGQRFKSFLIIFPPALSTDVSAALLGINEIGQLVALDSQNRPQSNISCSSKLPNGKTVGDMVQQLNQRIAQSEDEGNGLSGALTFFQGVNTGGILDFKNTMRGQGFSGSYLADAGNFAYGAAGADYFGNNPVGAQITYFGGTVYAGTHLKAKITPPGTIFPQDASGARNIGAGFKSGGC